MKQLSIEQKKIINDQMSALRLTKSDRYVYQKGFEFALSHQPTPAKVDLEELRERFEKESFVCIELDDEDVSIDYNKVWDFFSPFLSNNNAEELQKENEQLKFKNAALEDIQEILEFKIIKSDSVIAELRDACKVRLAVIKEGNNVVSDLTAKLKECEREWISVEKELPELNEEY